jgi:hypothetical protein
VYTTQTHCLQALAAKIEDTTNKTEWRILLRVHGQLLCMTSCWISRLLRSANVTFCCCSESLHFAGLAISACLLTSSPRTTCAADSSAALRATAQVRSKLFRPKCVPGHVLHLCDLYCDCLSQPLSSLSFSVHISHFITCFPAPSPTSPQIPTCFPDCVGLILVYYLL